MLKLLALEKLRSRTLTIKRSLSDCSIFAVDALTVITPLLLVKRVSTMKILHFFTEEADAKISDGFIERD